MKKWRLVIATCLLAVLTSCATAPINISGHGSAVDQAFGFYRAHKTSIDSHNVVAMLSYTSSSISRTRHDTWKGYQLYFSDYIMRMRRNGMINKNYPVNPGRWDVSTFDTFTKAWVNQMEKAHVSPKNGRARYPDDAGQLIFRIIDNEYNRNK